MSLLLLHPWIQLFSIASEPSYERVRLALVQYDSIWFNMIQYDSIWFNLIQLQSSYSYITVLLTLILSRIHLRYRHLRTPAKDESNTSPKHITTRPWRPLGLYGLMEASWRPLKPTGMRWTARFDCPLNQFYWIFKCQSLLFHLFSIVISAEDFTHQTSSAEDSWYLFPSTNFETDTEFTRCGTLFLDALRARWRQNGMETAASSAFLFLAHKAKHTKTNRISRFGLHNCGFRQLPPHMLALVAQLLSNATIKPL